MIEKILIILLILSSFLNTAYCQEDNFNVTKVGGYLAGRDVKDVAISGDYAFCADDYGLSVWDLSEPENPTEIVRRPTPGLAWSIDIHENYVYIGDYWRGFSIFDVSDPTNPQLVNKVEINFHPANAIYRLKVYIHDNVLYYLSNVLGLFVYSLDDAENPELLSRFSEGTNFIDIDVKGDLAYISCYNSDYILIMNIEHPEQLEVINRIELDFHPRVCDIQEDILALGDLRDDRLYLFSIEDPLNPELLGQCEAGAGAIRLEDDYAYLAENIVNIRVVGDEFTVVDITNPADPQIVEIIEPLGGEAITIKDNIAYTASRWQGLMAVLIENPEAPELTNDPMIKHNLVTSDVVDSIAYVQDLARGLEILDVAELENTNLISEWLRNRLNHDDFITRSTLKVGDYIYTGATWSISVIDINDIENPERVHDFFQFDWGFNTVNKMYKLGDYLYITGRFRDEDDVDDYMNLYVFNVENPGQPEVAFQRRELDFGMGYSSLDNNILYQVAKDNPGSDDHYVLVYDVEDPSQPRYRGRWRSGIYESMLVHNQVAYIYFDDAINVYTVENPTDPEFVGSLQIDREITDMCIEGEIIYLSAGIFGFYCMSIADPTDPEIVGYYDTPGTVYQCQGIDGYLYVCDDYELGIYDCAEIHGIWDLQLGEDAHNFGEVQINTDSTFQLTINNYALQPVEILDILTDSLAFTVNFDSAFTIEPDSEAIAEVTFTPSEQRHYNGMLIIHTERRDLTVGLSGTGVDLSVTDEDLMPLEFGLYPAYPNPFNCSTTITYGLDRAAPTRLALYDLSGREVVTLFEGYKQAGYHTATLTSGDLTSGLYFVRLDAGGFSQSRKLILVR